MVFEGKMELGQVVAEVGSGEAAEVVLRGHHFAVGTGAAEGDEVAAAGRGEEFVLAEHVAALADRADYVVTLQFALVLG